VAKRRDGAGRVSSRHRSLPIPIPNPLLRRLASFPPASPLSDSDSSDSDEEEEKSGPNRLVHASRISALDAILGGGSGTRGRRPLASGGHELVEGDDLEDAERPEAEFAGEACCGFVEGVCACEWI
jgi:hypothetical protein